MTRLLSGSEAIARGAFEGGVHVAAACPGAPAGEILAALEGTGEVACRRAPSEKAALDVALGAALGGARALCAVRAGALEATGGSLLAASCAGAAGLVIAVCDDPGARRSAPTDSRPAARSAMLPVLEPSDPAECAAFAATAFELSERFGTPVVIRLTLLLAESAEPVATGPRRPGRPRGQRWPPVPPLPAAWRFGAHRLRALERMALVAAHAWDTPLNRSVPGGAEMGVVTSGLLYGAVREALPEASVLKLGLVHPVPTGLVREFASRVHRLYVVEELEPFLEQELRAAGIACEGKNRLSRTGEIGPSAVARAFGTLCGGAVAEVVPARPPELCPGCPHRATFSALKRLHVTVNGDLGCAALAALPPLAALHRAPGLGASTGVTSGLDAALGERIRGRQVAVIGDGALLHSGLGALAAGGCGALVVADNGPDLRGENGRGGEVRAEGGWRTDLAPLVRALGIHDVRVADPLDLAATMEEVRAALGAPGPAAVIARSPCMRLRRDVRPPVRVDERRCNRCGACLRLGCPALSDGPEAIRVEERACAGCGLCAQVCRPGALLREARS